MNHKDIEKELSEILMPAELVTDLEAQITNQIKDLLSTHTQKLLESKAVEIEGLKIEIPEKNANGECKICGMDYYEDCRCEGWNDALDSVLQIIRGKK